MLAVMDYSLKAGKEDASRRSGFENTPVVTARPRRLAHGSDTVTLQKDSFLIMKYLSR